MSAASLAPRGQSDRDRNFEEDTRLQVARYRLLVPGCRGISLMVARCWLLDLGLWTLDIGLSNP